MLCMRLILILESKGWGESTSFSCRSGQFGRERQGYCSVQGVGPSFCKFILQILARILMWAPLSGDKHLFRSIFKGNSKRFFCRKAPTSFELYYS